MKSRHVLVPMITIDLPSSSASELTPANKSSLARFLLRVRRALNLTGKVEVLLTGDAELKRLNKTFRGKNKTTDVLSFPAPPEIAVHHAGDLAISLDTASRQAKQFGHTLTDEVKVLLLHGVLHLAGHDHETDSGEMAAQESALRQQLGIPNSLIQRVSP